MAAPAPAAPAATLAVAVVGPAGRRRDETCRMLAGCPQVHGPAVAASVRGVVGVRPELVLVCTDAPARDVRAVVADAGSAPRVLVVSAVTDEDEVVEALRAGATSYLVDGQFPCSELLAAVLTTSLGHSHLSPPALTAVVSRLQGPEPVGAPAEVLSALSRREREIMTLVAAGHSNASIARELFLAEKTVRNHLHRVYAKLVVRSRAEAIVTWLGRTPGLGRAG